VASRHPGALADRGLVAEGYAGTEDPVARDSSEHVLGPLEVADHGVAPDDPLSTARLIAGVVSLDRPGKIQVDQLVRSGHRKRPQQDLIEQREDRYRVDKRRRAESAERVPEVAHLRGVTGVMVGHPSAPRGLYPRFTAIKPLQAN